MGRSFRGGLPCVAGHGVQLCRTLCGSVRRRRSKCLVVGGVRRLPKTITPQLVVKLCRWRSSRRRGWCTRCTTHPVHLIHLPPLNSR